MTQETPPDPKKPQYVRSSLDQVLKDSIDKHPTKNTFFFSCVLERQKDGNISVTSVLLKPVVD